MVLQADEKTTLRDPPGEVGRHVVVVVLPSVDAPCWESRELLIFEVESYRHFLSTRDFWTPSVTLVLRV